MIIISLISFINIFTQKYIAIYCFDFNNIEKVDIKPQLKDLDINKINFFQGYRILNFTFFKLFIDIIMMMKIYFKDFIDIKFKKKESDFCFIINVNTIILLVSLIAYSFSYIKIKMSKVQIS